MKMNSCDQKKVLPKVRHPRGRTWLAFGLPAKKICRYANLAFVFLAWSISNLAVAAEQPIGSTPPAQELASGGGLVVLSLGSRSLTPADRLYLQLRKIDTQKTYDILFSPRSRAENIPHDFSYKQIHASVYLLRLPAGQYEIFSFVSKQQVLASPSILQRNQSGLTPSTATVRPKQDFSIPFVIEPGKATYIGQFIHSIFYRKGTNALLNSGASYFVVSNQQVRDVATAHKRGDIPAELPVISAIPDLIAINSPVIRGAVITEADVAAP
jgi:hypothetical protein